MSVLSVFNHLFRARLSRKALLGATVCAISLTVLQTASAQEDPSLATPAQPIPYQPQATDTIQNAASQPGSSLLSDADSQALSSALQAVKSGNFSYADSLAHGMSNPVARKIVTWAIISNDGNIYGFPQLDAARRDLWGWPREQKRQIAAEKLIALSGMTPQQVVDWFQGSPPQSVEGATALITAYGNLAQRDKAQALAKDWWRNHVFDSIAQANFYQAFGSYLDQSDHTARLACLELNVQSGQSQAIRDMTAYAAPHQADIAAAVIAMRTGAASSDSLYQTALAGDPHNKVLAFARARYLSSKGLEPLGFALLPDLPSATMSPEAASQLYGLRLAYFKAALKAHDYRAAYNAMNGGGFQPGESMAEAEFFAGWMALVKLNDVNAAISHFQTLATAGTSPITQGRANYWLGRAYEARNDASKNDADTAHAYYVKGGQYIYAFYGQMAAEKAGVTTISIGKDPVPTQADRDRFNSRDMVQAARILGNLGQTDLFRQIVLTLDTVLPNAEEEALLVDMTASYDTQVVAMKVARMSMQRGFYLPERAYPMRGYTDIQGPEKAFTLAIARQESGFDPSVRSGANAKGVMQLIPSTARAVANRLNMPWNEAKLYDADYNMTIGAHHLGELVDHFGGSYIMAAAGYNAGPSRMGTWIGDCGDPRGPNADPLSFIECHPLTETRNYMMRVIENMRVYRARLNGGTAPLTAMADVTRGIPMPIGGFDPDDVGDGSELPSTPVNYLDYQKGAQAAAADAQPAAAVMSPIPDPIAKPAPVKPAKASTSKKDKAKSSRTEKKTTSKKHRR